MGTIVLKNKKEKEKKLYNSAYSLFLEKGIENTTVDQIAKNAGVAKGTFYLYFKDKYDLIEKLVCKKSYKLAKEALKKTRDSGITEFDESILYFTDYIISYFKENTLMLRIISKNFSTGLYRDNVGIDLEEREEANEILNIFIDNLKKKGYSEKEAKHTLYMIIELVGSVCYNSIILNKPCEIEEIKPILFKKIKNMIS